MCCLFIKRNRENELTKEYNERADALALAIENHFGANIEGLSTYRYFDGNVHLRHWICLPLVMGINNRQDTTKEKEKWNSTKGLRWRTKGL